MPEPLNKTDRADAEGFRVVAMRWAAYAWLVCSVALMVSCAAGWGQVG